MTLTEPLLNHYGVVGSLPVRSVFAQTLLRLVIVAAAQLYSRFDLYLRQFELLVAVDQRRQREERLAASVAFMTSQLCCLTLGWRKFRQYVQQSPVRADLGDFSV